MGTSLLRVFGTMRLPKGLAREKGIEIEVKALKGVLNTLRTPMLSWSLKTTVDLTQTHAI
ncbi:MAG: hypothetical protein QXT06_02085 [Candidatus Bathyarchaeia archaeon]